MKNLKNYLWAAICLAVLIGSLAFTRTSANQSPTIAACEQRCATVIRNADEPARNPFRSQVILSWSPGSPVVSNNFPSVPANKRLVVEYAAVEAGVPSGQSFFMQLQSAGLSYSLVVTKQAAFPAAGSVGPTDIYTAAQPMRIYVDAGNSLTAFADRNDATGGSGINIIVAISGYLVDLP